MAVQCWQTQSLIKQNRKNRYPDYVFFPLFAGEQIRRTQFCFCAKKENILMKMLLYGKIDALLT